MGGADSSRTIYDEDQGGGAPGKEVLCVDWWLHPVFTEHIPADVDLQAGIRRVWPHDCPPEVLLRGYYNYQVALGSSSNGCLRAFDFCLSGGPEAYVPAFQNQIYESIFPG